MFGLPASAAIIIFGIPSIWVIYTLVFVYVSRHWSAEDVEEDAGIGSTAARTEGGGAA